MKVRSDVNTDDSTSDRQDKIKHLEELNRILIHNIRGGLANIKVLTEMMMQKKIDKKNRAIPTGEGLSLIHSSSASMLDSLNALMGVASMEQDGNIKHHPCDIAGIVQAVKNQLYTTIFRKGADIRLDLNVPVIHYPCPYMESILYNLISNALKYTHDSICPEITIATYMAAGRPVLSVKDNGIGIDMAAYGHRLFRLNQTFHKGYDSKGVGLYITKTQIESLGGTITVKSQPDQGTEFIVKF